jgi:hypothetical protein
MTHYNQQIGWSQEAKLLQEISEKLDKLIKLTSSTVTTTTTVLP